MQGNCGAACSHHVVAVTALQQVVERRLVLERCRMWLDWCLRRAGKLLSMLSTAIVMHRALVGAPRLVLPRWWPEGQDQQVWRLVTSQLQVVLQVSRSRVRTHNVCAGRVALLQGKQLLPSAVCSPVAAT